MSRMLSALFVILALSSAGLAQEEDRSGLRASVLYGYNLKGWEKPADHDIIVGFGYVLQPGFGIDLEIGTHGG